MPAFFNDSSTYSNMYTFDSWYSLRDQVDTQLNDLLTAPRTIAVFCSFESTFYTLMTAMAQSLSEAYYYEWRGPQCTLNIHISKLEQMPCMADAVYALQMVLVWVSLDDKLICMEYNH